MREKKVNRLLDSLQILEDKNAPSPKEQKYASLEKKGKNQKKKKKQKTRKENGKASVTKWYALKKEKQLSYFNSRKNA